MTFLPADIDAALYAELVPHRPTPADPLRMDYGPTEQFRLLELERELWATLALFDDIDEVGAA